MGTWVEIEGCGIFGTWQSYGEDTAAYRFAKSGENAGSSPPCGWIERLKNSRAGGNLKSIGSVQNWLSEGQRGKGG